MVLLYPPALKIRHFALILSPEICSIIGAYTLRLTRFGDTLGVIAPFQTSNQRRTKTAQIALSDPPSTGAPG